MALRWVAGSLGIIALALPLLELVGIYQVWHYAGWWTLALLALAALAGIWLMALERLAFMPRMLATLASGAAPFAVLTGSGIRFIAAGLLIFPGFFSDALAVLLILASLFFRGAAPSAAPRQPGGGMPPRDGRAANDDVIEGEFERIDQ